MHQSLSVSGNDYFSYVPPSSQTCAASPAGSAKSSQTSISTTTCFSIKRFISSLSPGHDAWSHQPRRARPPASPAGSASNKLLDQQEQQNAVETHENITQQTTVTATNRSSPRSPDDECRQTRQQLEQSLGNNQQTVLQPDSPNITATTSENDADNDDDFDLLDDDDYDYDDNEEDEDDDDYDYDDEEEDEYEEEDDDTMMPNDDLAAQYFRKTQPSRPAGPRRSLLSAMLQQEQQQQNRSMAAACPPVLSKTQHHPACIPQSSRSSQHLLQVAQRDHFLRKELTESLRRNILWEHIQQKALYHKSPIMLRRQRNNNQRVENNPSEAQISGWLGSFHGW